MYCSFPSCGQYWSHLRCEARFFFNCKSLARTLERKLTIFSTLKVYNIARSTFQKNTSAFFAVIFNPNTLRHFYVRHSALLNATIACNSIVAVKSLKDKFNEIKLLLSCNVLLGTKTALISLLKIKYKAEQTYNIPLVIGKSI